MLRHQEKLKNGQIYEGHRGSYCLTGRGAVGFKLAALTGAYILKHQHTACKIEHVPAVYGRTHRADLYAVYPYAAL